MGGGRGILVQMGGDLIVIAIIIIVVIIIIVIMVLVIIIIVILVTREIGSSSLTGVNQWMAVMAEHMAQVHDDDGDDDDDDDDDDGDDDGDDDDDQAKIAGERPPAELGSSLQAWTFSSHW